MNAKIVAAVCACTLLAACRGHGAGVTPNPSPSGGIPNVSGNYTGTVTDSAQGGGSVKATLAQHDVSVGGPIALIYTGSTINGSLALTVDSTGTLVGTQVLTISSSQTCTFSFSGNYDTTTNQISASYSAVNGCSGQNGTLTLQQQCSNPPAGALRLRKRVHAASLPPC